MRQPPAHLFDEELEDEFVCSMIRAAQRVEGDSADWAAEYFMAGLEVSADLLGSPRARAIYEAAISIVEEGGVPSWSLVYNRLLEKGAGVARTRVAYLLGMSTGLISAIPTFVDRLKDLAAQRAAYAG